MLSAKIKEADKVTALSLGADDYMTKPFGLAELLARVRALLRRGRLNKPLASSPGSKDGSRIYLDVPGRRLLVEGEDIETTAKEFDLLRLFMSHPLSGTDPRPDHAAAVGRRALYPAHH